MRASVCRSCLVQYRETAARTIPGLRGEAPRAHMIAAPVSQRRCFSAAAPGAQDPASILAKPSWSVRSLLSKEQPREVSETSVSSPSQTTPLESTTITPQQLRHLLRLSALPPPETPKEEVQMISVLQSQLRFVRDIQAVDTTGIEPLRSIRDETAAGVSEQTIGVDQLRAELATETVFGHSRRPKRGRSSPEAEAETAKAEDWDVFGTASRKAGRYFVVSSASGVRQ